MGRFGWIFYSYIGYLIAQIGINAWYSVEGKPILALGYLSSWWLMLLVFLLAYLSEWGAILLERGEN